MKKGGINPSSRRKIKNRKRHISEFFINQSAHPSAGPSGFFLVTALSLLSPERAALSEPGLATGGLAEDSRAASADDDGLGVREDGGDSEAAGALDVHKEGAGRRHKGLYGKRKKLN